MTELVISGMTCDPCATQVRQALEKVPGVRSAQVSYPSFDTDPRALIPPTGSVTVCRTTHRRDFAAMAPSLAGPARGRQR